MDSTIDRHRFDRRCYLIVAIVFPLTVLAGFGRTYDAKQWFGTPPLPSAREPGQRANRLPAAPQGVQLI